MFGDFEAFEGEADAASAEEDWGSDAITPLAGCGRSGNARH